MKHLVRFNEDLTEVDSDLLQDKIIEETEIQLAYLLDDDFDFVSYRFYDSYKIYSDKISPYFNCIRLTIGQTTGERRIPTDDRNYHRGYTLINSSNNNSLVSNKWIEIKDIIIPYIDRIRKLYNLNAVELNIDGEPKRTMSDKQGISDRIIRQLINLTDDHLVKEITLIFAI